MKKILIAEDDQFLGSAYRLKLSKEGFDVKVAVDGEEALHLIEEFTPDLIILDIMMPKKDGFAVLQELKAQDKWKSIPILMASNLGQKEDLEKAKSFGATDYIIKSNMPLNELIAKVNSLVQGSK
jgi:DNA-binding response OmpR family regulator